MLAVYDEFKGVLHHVLHERLAFSSLHILAEGLKVLKQGRNERRGLAGGDASSSQAANLDFIAGLV